MVKRDSAAIVSPFAAEKSGVHDGTIRTNFDNKGVIVAGESTLEGSRGCRKVRRIGTASYICKTSGIDCNSHWAFPLAAADVREVENLRGVRVEFNNKSVQVAFQGIRRRR